MKSKIILFFSILLLVSCGTGLPKFTKVLYPAWGTTCEVIYENPNGQDILFGLDSIFSELSASFSNYDSSSRLSKINENKTLDIDQHIYNLLEASKTVYQQSNGNFDPTIYPLVKLWGFMNKQGVWTDTAKIMALIGQVGLNKWDWNKLAIVSKPKESKIDFNAIAPGYAADIIANYLDRIGIKNYYVNNGGELVLKGKGQHGDFWEIGINSPNNPEKSDTSYRLTNTAMATSGNYRNYFERGGIKYGHTISPKTGMPIKTNVLSATVFANSAMLADAMATGCMTMDVQEASLFLQQNHCTGYLIYEIKKNELARLLVK